MRAFQLHPATIAGCRRIPVCPVPSTGQETNGRLAVLNSPGHAKSCYPCPFGRRRRRR